MISNYQPLQKLHLIIRMEPVLSFFHFRFSREPIHPYQLSAFVSSRTTAPEAYVSP